LSMKQIKKLKEKNVRLKLWLTNLSKRKELKSIDSNKKLEEKKLNNKWNWRGLKEKKELKKLVRNILEFKLKGRHNMNNLLLREMLE